MHLGICLLFMTCQEPLPTGKRLSMCSENDCLLCAPHSWGFDLGSSMCASGHLPAGPVSEWQPVSMVVSQHMH